MSLGTRRNPQANFVDVKHSKTRSHWRNPVGLSKGIEEGEGNFLSVATRAGNDAEEMCYSDCEDVRKLDEQCLFCTLEPSQLRKAGGEGGSRGTGVLPEKRDC